MLKCQPRRAAHRGQGVIEYGGALVVAAVFVATATAILNPEFLAGIMATMQASLQETILP